jgi:hypothetical protein
MAPGATCTLKVVFSPAGNAETGKTFTDASNLRLNWQYKACAVGSCTAPNPGGQWAGPVKVTGTVLATQAGTEAELEVQQGTALDLGTLQRGRTYPYELTLRNKGKNELALYSFNSTGQTGSWIDAQGSISQIDISRCRTLAAGASCTATFTVTPGTWMTAGQVRGIVYKTNGQDRVTYKAVTAPSVQITYRVGN